MMNWGNLRADAGEGRWKHVGLEFEIALPVFTGIDFVKCVVCI